MIQKSWLLLTHWFVLYFSFARVQLLLLTIWLAAGTRLLAPQAQKVKTTQSKGWIDLSYHQHEIGCPDAVDNVVNLRFSGCCSPTL